MINDIEPNSTFDKIRVRILSKNGPRMIGKAGKRRSITEVLIIDQRGTT